jgi:hypothetical protein
MASCLSRGEAVHSKSITIHLTDSLLKCCLIIAVLVIAPGCSEDVTCPQDTIPPSAVTDLTAYNPTLSSIKLIWTVPGDDWMTGKAAQYDLRYSLSLIDYSNWDSATLCVGEPEPGDPGATDTYTVSGLMPDTTYYFVMKAADDAPNWSDLSNVASLKTAAGNIVAWGKNDYGQCDVPEPNESFMAVSGHGSFRLGLKSDGTIVAWGYNDYYQCDVPEPNEGFVAVAGGRVAQLGAQVGRDDRGLGR